MNWDALAQGSPVLIFYMALKHMSEISRRLIGAGRHPMEPVALVSKAATQEQSVVLTTLAEAAEAAANIDPPAVVAIGEVVRLRPALNWLGALEGEALTPDPLGTDTHRQAV